MSIPTSNDLVAIIRSLCLAIPGDAHSFLLVTVQKTSAYDDAVTTLPAHPELRALLESIRFTRS